MLGAIVGDIVGSIHEFEGMKTTDFELFTPQSTFTDDSVMTAAVAEALLDLRSQGVAPQDPAADRTLVDSLRRWGARYPHPMGGYGGRFASWLTSTDPRPYNSWGNGAAMRVSAAGWLFDSLEETKEWAAATARITHNHPHGIAGAQAVAVAIFLTRSGAGSEEVRAALRKDFGYDLSRTVEQIRPHCRFEESSQRSVPEALCAYFDATGFEDALRLVISLGGDADTQGAITGSIAEAAFGVPEAIGREAQSRLDRPLKSVLRRFREAIGC